MRKFTLITAIAACSLTAGAAVITPGEAINRITASGDMAKVRGMSGQRLRLVDTRSIDAEPAIYVFANGESGYVFATADDTTAPLLGYVESGSYDPDNLPPALVFYLDDAAAQVEWARTEASKQSLKSNSPLRVQHANYAEIQPMVKTQWNQSTPFNNMCPEIDGERCVTGCVATALAQVIAYHKYPVNGTGSKSYTWTSGSTSTTLSYDYSTANFDWANMLDTYDGTYTETQANAVANLMYACGVGVEMDYGINGSGAATAQSANVLRDYLGYRKDIHSESRSYYDILGWDELVYNQLRDFGPVQFSGSNNEGGHSFVCDGYRPGGYYHFNWGWGGMSDGYFLLTALDPTSQGIGGSSAGYNFNVAIIANVAPDPDGTAPEYYAITCDGLTVSAESCPLGGSVTIQNFMANSSSVALTGSLGMQVKAQDGTISYITLGNFSELPPNYGYSNITLTIPSSMAAGTYTLTPVFKINGGEWQPMKVNQSKGAYLTMEVKDGTAYFTQHVPSVEVSDLAAESEFFIGKPFHITATVTNNSGAEFDGYIFGVLFDSQYQQVGSSDAYPIFLSSGESMPLDYISSFNAGTGKTISAGDYYFGFADSNGKLVSTIMPLTLKTASADTKYTFTNLKLEGNTSAADRHNLVFTADVTCTSGYFTGSFDLVIFPYIPNQSVSSMAQANSGTLFVPAGQTAKATFRFDFTEGTPGNKYFTHAYCNGTALSGTQILFTLSDTDAVQSLTADDQVVATEVYSLMGVKIGASIEGLLPGHYIVRETKSDGTVTARHIAIIR